MKTPHDWELDEEVEAAMMRVRESRYLFDDVPRSVGVAYLQRLGQRTEELAAELEHERMKHGG